MSVRPLLILALGVAVASGQSLDPDRVNVMIEALSRLAPEQVHANAKLKEALAKVLDATRGTPRFVELVRKFQLKDQSAGLLEVAKNHPGKAAGADAIRLILESKDTDLLRQALASDDISAALPLVEALGNAGGSQAIPLLEPLLADLSRDVSVRNRAVRSLAQFREGAVLLLNLTREDRLAADLKSAATTELNQARWPEVRAEAARLLPLPRTRNDQALPSIAELIRMKGEPARGATVFARADVACINCHEVNGKGIDFGPKLSEIGAKLAKEAFYEAILNPSAGISFDYEGWQIQLKNGDEATGLIVSETNDELSLKSQNGLVARYKKSEIDRRAKMAASIMPAGLQEALTVQDLVDLVEYLASLKKTSN